MQDAFQLRLVAPGFVEMGSLGISDGAGRVVDFRSDTVTKPTAAMRVAMANAEVDDDVQGVDPTMAELQNQMAQIMGKEAGLFVPSGTMGNLIAVLVHCDVSNYLLLIFFENILYFLPCFGLLFSFKFALQYALHVLSTDLT